MNPRIGNYDIYGMSLRVQAEHAQLLDGIEAMLGCFATDQAEGGFELAIKNGPVDSNSDPEFQLFWQGPLTDGPTLGYYTRPGARRIILGDLARLDLDLDLRRIEATVARGSEAMVSHCLYVPMLCEMLSHAGQHAIHAAALGFGESANRAVLLAGETGLGKTTSALALAKAGMRLLSDDTCLVLDATTGAGVEVWGLRRSCRVREKTLQLLPWLRQLPRRPSPAPQTCLVDLGQLWPARKCLASPVAIMLLEEPNPGGHRVEAVEKVIACQELIRQNVHAVEPLGSGSAGSAMRAITRLVAQCGTWRLSVGADVGSLRACLMDLLEPES